MSSVDQEIDQHIPQENPYLEEAYRDKLDEESARPKTVGGRPRSKRDTVAFSPGDTESAYAEALAQVQSQVRELKDELRTTRQGGEELADSGVSGFPWQFYRRPIRKNDPMSGWIVSAPGGTASTGRYAGRRAVEQYAHYQSKGFLPLTQYGPSPVPVTSNGADVMRHLLERGGAKEFPATQVLAYKWHIEPPLEGMKFPEYEKIRGTEILAQCEECNWDLYGLENEVQVSIDFLRHLRQSHGYPRREAALLIREQGLPPIGRMAVRADQMLGTAMDEPDEVVVKKL